MTMKKLDIDPVLAEIEIEEYLSRVEGAAPEDEDTLVEEAEMDLERRCYYSEMDDMGLSSIFGDR